MMPQLRTLRLATLATVFLLSGCPAVSSIPGGDNRPPLRNADYFLQNAKSVDGDRRALMLLSAGELLLEENRQKDALDVLWPLRNNRFNERDEARLRLALADALVAAGRGDDGLAQVNLLRGLRPSDAQDQKSRELEMRGLLLQQKPLEAISVQLDRAARQPGEASILLREVWPMLQKVETGLLEQARASVRNPQLAGWLDLAAHQRRYRQDPDGLKLALNQWRQQYRNHPALGLWPEELKKADAANRLDARSVALLLPLSGRYAATGRLVRDGFLAAWYNEAQSGQVQVVDSGDDVVAAYRLAVQGGAQAVVGPLLKEQVAQLQALGTLPVPTLALNLSDKPDPVSNLWQFGLPVEAEAGQLAVRAIASYRRALILTSDDAVGERAAASLKAQFQALGGEVVASAKLGEAGVEPQIASLLGIDASRARQKALQQSLGRELTATPRRRQDIDVVLMVTRPAVARAAKPWLNHFYAQDIPVLATSSLFSGLNNPAQDRDLDGIEFCDAPWFVDTGETLSGLRRDWSRWFPGATGTQGRLFALGHDAARLLPELDRLRAFNHYRLQGLTGELSVDANGQVHRQLAWARFREGRLTTLAGGSR